MPPTSDELWNYHCMPLLGEFVVFMPNGTILNLQLGRDTTLSEAKQQIWNLAKAEPMYRLLKPSSSYVFVGITTDAKTEEFHEESRHICDLRLFQPVLRLVEPKGDADEMITQTEISKAIGRSEREFDTSNDTEFFECRRSFLTLSHAIVSERCRYSSDEKLLYYFSPDFDPINSVDKPPAISEKEVNCLIHLSDASVSPSLSSIEMSFRANLTVSEVLSQLSQKHSLPEEKVIFKVCGFEEYLLGNYKLYQYKYISDFICQKKTVELMICKEANILSFIPSEQFIQPPFFNTNEHLDSERMEKLQMQDDFACQQIMPLWKINDSFQVQVNVATYANVKDYDKVFVCIGLYHGTEALCSQKRTKETLSQTPKWAESLAFDINIDDLPRTTKLCLSMCSVCKKSSESIPIAYGNIPLFDFKGKLMSGKVSLNLWRIPKEHSGLLNPFGVTGPNPERDALSVEIEFQKHQTPVYFPPDDSIRAYAKHLHDLESKLKENQNDSRENRRIRAPSDSEKQQLEELVWQDSLAELSENEKDLMWRSRAYCCEKLPDALPKLLESVKWNCRDDVAQLYFLLDSWPLVKVETALVLLDCKFSDLKVRSFAIRCLERALPFHSSKEYLLQLIQVVLHEMYLNTDTSRFLLTRALKSRAFGHQFFWLLKAESHNPSNSRICSLLMESYCRGIGPLQLKSTLKQIDAIEKLTFITEVLREKRDLGSEKRHMYLKETLKQPEFVSALEYLPNPLRPKISLGHLLVEECRIMDSAKRPLWLAWKNGDPTFSRYSESNNNIHELIFKNGDDLRQDMLTLQVIRIMDAIWRSESLDLMMLPYTCLITGKQKGLIEVVKDARTVMHVQRSLGLRAAFQVGSRELHRWFEEHSTEHSNEKYLRMMDNFQKSCAGYCVATFVLGIGDRNPDNIMINDDGQIFHIDFGHFLGHFKKKFGINRERVPFVLTDDFLFVICRGGEINDENIHLQNFIKLCEKAYMILRKHANLLTTLFMLMLRTGIPELQSLDDIDYLRSTLQMDKDDKKALDYFRSQLQNAKIGSTYTKIDWFFHNVRR